MSKGFTLIEILIVFTIIALVTGGGVLYLNRTNALQKIDTSKQELLSNLRFARNLAITNQKPVGFGDLAQVNVDLTPGGIMTLKPLSVGGSLGSSYMSKDLTPNGVSVAFSTGTTFGFSAYEGKFLGTNDTLVITISSSEIGDTGQLIITQLGLINDL